MTNYLIMRIQKNDRSGSAEPLQVIVFETLKYLFSSLPQDDNVTRSLNISLRKPMMNEPETIRKILKESKTVAVVGLSDKPGRYSYVVASYLMDNGYKIIPVNPNISEWKGLKSFASLKDVPEKIDVVDIFRRSEFVKEVVEETIAVRAKAIWMQEGVMDEKAAEKTEKAGLLVVMDRCMMKEHRKLG